MSISIPALFQMGLTCGAFALACFGFAHWKRHYMRFFFCLSIAVFFSCAGYLINLLAPELQSAFMGTRLIYLGAPFVGFFTMLFAFEYSNYAYKTIIAVLLALFPITTMLLVFTWPLSPLFYTDVQFVESAMGSYLKVSPGTLYYPFLFYNLGLCLVSLLWVMLHLMKLNLWRTRNTIVFTTAIIIVAVIFLLRIAQLIPGWFDPIPIIEVFGLFITALHITWFQQREWHSVGREHAIENIKDAFILIDDKQQFLDANQAAFRYFPELRSFPRGTPIARLGAVADTLLHADENASLVLGEAEKRYLRVSRSNMETQSKRFVGQTIMLYDDTERETLIKELREAREKAEQSTKAKSLFLARTSHEIRTPMNAIIGMAELLLREELPPNVYDEALEIRRAAYMLLSIINDILDFSKIESGKFEITEDEYQCTSLINDVISITRTRLAEKHIRFITNIDSHIPAVLTGDEARLRQMLLNLLSNAVKYTDEGNITLTVDAAPADEQRIGLRFEVSDTGRGIKEEDMANLFSEFTRLDNTGMIQGTGLGLVIARQFARLMGGDIIAQSEYGEGSVFTAFIPQQVTDPSPFAVVKNPESKTVLLFERRALYAASIAYTLKNLSVPYNMVNTLESLFEELKSDAYRFVFVPALFLEQTSAVLQERALQGWESHPTLISLSSFNLGQDRRSVRALIMPAYALSIANILNDVSDSKDPSYEPVEDVRFIAPDARVLIVDDVVINLKVARGLVAPYKMQIDCCTSGAEALRLVQEKAYDLVLMDHMMPDMNGVETLKAIRVLEDAYVQTLPIVVLTANAMKGMRQEYLDYGFQDYLMKPIDIARLDAVLAQWIPHEKQLKDKHVPSLTKDNDKVGRGKWREELQYIEGLDIEDALTHVGTMENYLEVLKQFCAEMQGYIEGVGLSLAVADWATYALRVHSVKGAFATIGVKSIADWAKTLELAAKEGNTALCQEQTSEFCDATSAMRERLCGILPSDEQALVGSDAAPMVDAAFIKEKLEALYVACYNFKSDDAEALINTLNQVSFKERWYDTLSGIRQLVGGYEYEAAGQAIQDLLKELSGTD
jgi:signal transduction histidine kinase/CheY-like chemotaxis protein/HPt (histidine-containing phosphotransfer) domain-containing protein